MRSVSPNSYKEVRTLADSNNYIMSNDSVLVCKGYGIKMIRMKGDTLMIKMDGEILYYRDKIKKYRVKLLSLK